MRTVLYPGSFDPVTNGHMDIIRRAAKAFDTVIVGILYNPSKPAGAFPVDVRISLLENALSGLDNVQVAAFGGLLIEAVQACGADAVIRGLRTTADVEIELQMARINHELGGVETLLMAAAPETVHISASMVREIARFGGDIAPYVPPSICKQVAALLKPL